MNNILRFLGFSASEDINMNISDAQCDEWDRQIRYYHEATTQLLNHDSAVYLKEIANIAQHVN